MNRKEFTIKEGDGREVKLVVRQPTYDEYEKADRVYATKIASLVKENTGKRLLSRQDLNSYLKESGTWTDEDEEKVKSIQKEIAETLAEIRRGGKKVTEGRALAIKVMDKRKEMVRVMAKRQVLDDVTIESFAENEKLDYLIYVSTVYADSGDDYWDSFEDMKNDKFSDAYKQASGLAMQIFYDIDPEFEKNLPENKWLKKYGFVDEDLNYVDRKTGEKVDRDGRPVAELEEELKKQIADIRGDIVEEQPFIDDETNEPIVTN